MHLVNRFHSFLSIFYHIYKTNKVVSVNFCSLCIFFLFQNNIFISAIFQLSLVFFVYYCFSSSNNRLYFYIFFTIVFIIVEFL